MIKLLFVETGIGNKTLHNANRFYLNIRQKSETNLI